MDSKLPAASSVSISQDGLDQEAVVADDEEHNMTMKQALKLYPKAIFWSLFFSLGVIMCSFDAQLIGNLFATPAFQRDFGYRYRDGYIIPASWQTGLSMGSPLGQVVGALFAAYPMDWYGRKKTFGACIILTTGCVFLQFFARSLAILLAGELIAGLVLGSYVVIAPAYASEVCPLALRGVLTGFTNLAFVFGQLLANCIIAGTSRLDSHWAYSAAFAVQWFWPAVVLIGLPWAPESPWWLQRADRIEEAEEALKRLSSPTVDVKSILAKIIATDRAERENEAGSTYADCFNKFNIRRTEIATGVYCIQVLSGVYLVSYATYFFQLAGLPTTLSFTLSIIFLLLGLFGTILSFPLIYSYPHKTIYLIGLSILCVLQYTIGILDCLPSNTTTNTNKQGEKNAYAQAILMLFWNFVYGTTLGPLTFAILTAISSPRVRAKTIAFATAMQACLGIVMAVVIPYLINPDKVNAKGKIGFFFGSLCLGGLVWVWARVVEVKGLDWGEIDALFEKLRGDTGGSSITPTTSGRRSSIG